MNFDYLTESKLIKQKATEFLGAHNIVELLEKYGEFYFAGSHELDLMNRKDIDISINS